MVDANLTNDLQKSKSIKPIDKGEEIGPGASKVGANDRKAPNKTFELDKGAPKAEDVTKESKPHELIDKPSSNITNKIKTSDDFAAAENQLSQQAKLASNHFKKLSNLDPSILKKASTYKEWPLNKTSPYIINTHLNRFSDASKTIAKKAGLKPVEPKNDNNVFKKCYNFLVSGQKNIQQTRNAVTSASQPLDIQSMLAVQYKMQTASQEVEYTVSMANKFVEFFKTMMNLNL